MLRAQITGLVLAGGRGDRMGGVDKGLQPFRGRPLAVHMLDRLAPQVGPLMVSANRNLDVYRGFGAMVVTDARADFGGPLAGLASGLAACGTPFLASVPCDAPASPVDLVQRLAAAIDASGASIAIATVDHPGASPRLQPVFALLSVALRADLDAFTNAGGTKVRDWMARHATVHVAFDDAAAFANLNTLDDLREAEGRA